MMDIGSSEMTRCDISVLSSGPNCVQRLRCEAIGSVSAFGASGGTEMARKAVSRATYCCSRSRPRWSFVLSEFSGNQALPDKTHCLCHIAVSPSVTHVGPGNVGI